MKKFLYAFMITMSAFFIVVGLIDGEKLTGLDIAIILGGLFHLFIWVAEALDSLSNSKREGDQNETLGK